MKKNAVMIWIMLAAMLLGGCGIKRVVKDRFDSQEEARSIVLSGLQEKYGMEFFIVEDEEDYHNYGPIYGYSYTCDVAPKDEPEKVATAYIAQRIYTQLEDDFSLYFFKEEVEAIVKDMLDKKDYISSYTIRLHADTTTEVWTAEDDRDEYMKKNSGYVKADICLNDGLSNEEYTDMVMDLYESASQLEVSTILAVKVEDSYIFFREINVYAENEGSSLTREQVQDEIESSR